MTTTITCPDCGYSPQDVTFCVKYGWSPLDEFDGKDGVKSLNALYDEFAGKMK